MWNCKNKPFHGLSFFLQLFLFISVITIAPIGHSKPSLFTDKDLQKLLAASKKSPSKDFLIYSWSPHMVLSVKGLQELDLTAGRNTQTTVLLDPNADFTLARTFAHENKWPERVLMRNNSKQLLSKGAQIHFPNYIFIRGGRFNLPLLPGYKSALQIQRFKGAVK